jgi:hypothetical protein
MLAYTGAAVAETDPRYFQPMSAIGRRGTSRSARDVGAIRAKSMPDGQITENLCGPVQPMLEKYFA